MLTVIKERLTILDNKIKPSDIVKAFFTAGPAQVGKLLVIRNKVVSIFGLKTPTQINDRQQQLENFKYEPGEQLGLFKIFSKSENEIVMGEDDKHLNFRISLLLEKDTNDNAKKDITISTTVEFNNWFGKLYFLPVKPFHKIIVPSLLRGILKKLNH